CSDHDAPSSHLHPLYACRHAAPSRSWTSHYLSSLVSTMLQSRLTQLDLRTLSFGISRGAHRRIVRLGEGRDFSRVFAAISGMSFGEWTIGRTWGGRFPMLEQAGG